MIEFSSGNYSLLRKIFSVSMLFFSLIAGTVLSVSAQEYGVAVEESPFSAKVNPSLMGKGNSAGIAFSGDFDEKGITESYSVILSGNSLAYYYDSVEGAGSHNFALAFPGRYGIYTGTSLFFPENSNDIMWNLSTTVRPVRFLSVGLRGMDITSENSYLIYGAGIRPFFFSPYWISRLTLYTDLEYRSENEIAATGLRLEPFDGFNIFSEYIFDVNRFQAGISLSCSHMTAGVKGVFKDDYRPEKGKVFSSVTYKQSRSAVNLRHNLIAEYDMGNVISDYPQSGGFADFLQGSGKGFSNSLYNFIEDMDRIAETGEIKAVIFKNQHFMTSYANITEISEVLKKLRQKGKKIYFYFDNAGNNSYTLAASVADEIFVNPSGLINLRGYSKRSLYMKDFFSKFGIGFYNFRSHDYKTAYNSFSESQMTVEERDMLEKLYERYREKQVSMIVSGRRDKIKGDAAEIIAEGPYLSSREAELKGLIDRRIYRDELEGFYREMGYIPVRYSGYPPLMNYNWESVSSRILPVIYASGDIVSGNGIRGRMIGSESFVSAVRSARNNPAVKCIIIRINSGGGVCNGLRCYCKGNCPLQKR